MNWKLFFSTYCLVFVAELPDKTALATILMATRGSPVPLFIGVAAAFLVQSAIAVLFGSTLGLLPHGLVHLVAGLLFLLFAALAWRRNEEEEEHEDQEIIEKADGGLGRFRQAVWSSFAVIFIAEWGDLTQLATASLAARLPYPWALFLASTAALWSVTVLAIFVGHHAKKRIHPKLLNRIAAVAFGCVGLYFVFDAVGFLR